MTRSPLSRVVSLNFTGGTFKGGCWANTSPVNAANIAASGSSDLLNALLSIVTLSVLGSTVPQLTVAAKALTILLRTVQSSRKGKYYLKGDLYESPTLHGGDTASCGRCVRTGSRSTGGHSAQARDEGRGGGHAGPSGSAGNEDPELLGNPGGRYLRGRRCGNTRGCQSGRIRSCSGFRCGRKTQNHGWRCEPRDNLRPGAGVLRFGEYEPVCPQAQGRAGSEVRRRRQPEGTGSA